MRKPSVLIVEDNPLSRATAVAMFEDLGFTVFDAYSGHHALALLEVRPEIGLMFIDVRMPGMTGPELAEAVRRRRPEIKLVLTSGSVGEEAVPGGMDFVPKPWRVDQVARAVGLSGTGAPASKTSSG
jgi:CheY-like chemotaxis protein